MNLRLLFVLIFYSTLSFAQIDLPVDFENTTVSYFVDFGGNSSEVVADPTDPNNLVAKSTKGAASEPWAGTTIGEFGFDTAIPLDINNTTMSLRVYSEYPGTPIHMKLEDANDPALSVEARMYTTKTNEWETIVFDFINHLHNTPVLNLAVDYKKCIVFFDFGAVNNNPKDFYWDDVAMGGVSTTLAQLNLPVTFEETGISYALVDFENNSTTLGADPEDASQTVAITTKPVTTSPWSGTIVGTRNGFTNAIPFSPTASKVRMRVYSPAANTPILLKAESASNPELRVETIQYTSTANEWEVVEWNFQQHQPNTPAINYNIDYNLLAVFFNFGIDGASAGEQTYYWDDVSFEVETNTEELKTLSLSAYPNPVTNRLQIDTEEEITSVLIYNTIGQLVFSEKVEGDENVFDLSGLSVGAYFVNVKTKDGEGSFLLQKE